jgi:hypothetical protein
VDFHCSSEAGTGTGLADRDATGTLSLVAVSRAAEVKEASSAPSFKYNMRSVNSAPRLNSLQIMRYADSETLYVELFDGYAGVRMGINSVDGLYGPGSFHTSRLGKWWSSIFWSITGVGHFHLE